MDGPPTDDVCPICHDDFNIPAKTGCGHWYCTGCILTHWSYRGGIEICKCPKCKCDISKLMVDASFLDLRDEKVVQVMERVTQYNRLYAQRLPHVHRRMAHERERRLILLLINGYLCIAVPLTLIVVFLNHQDLFVTLPHDQDLFVTLPHGTEEIVDEWYWRKSLVNIVLFNGLLAFIAAAMFIAHHW